MGVPPQQKWAPYVGAIDDTWKPYIDTTDGSADPFLPIGFKIVNLSNIIIQYSFDAGVTVAGEIDPAYIQAEVFDNAAPPGRILYLKAAAGTTPRVAAAVWA